MVDDAPFGDAPSRPQWSPGKYNTAEYALRDRQLARMGFWPNFEGYRSYLQSTWWRARRLAFAADHPARCFVCWAWDGAELHHLRYVNLGNESDSDLRWLCRTHHGWTHRRQDYGGVIDTRMHVTAQNELLRGIIRVRGAELMQQAQAHIDKGAIPGVRGTVSRTIEWVPDAQQSLIRLTFWTHYGQSVAAIGKIQDSVRGPWMLEFANEPS